MKTMMIRSAVRAAPILVLIGALLGGCANTGGPPPSGSSQGKIAFVSNRGERPGDFHICVMNADGSGQRQLTSGKRVDGSPSWSPDGRKIAFSSDRNGNTDICVIDANGSSETRLTDNPASDSNPSWSPDGATILFTSSRDTVEATRTVREIYVMNGDGTNQTRLTHDGFVQVGKWSPDGTRILYTSQFTGTGPLGIYLMKPDGTDRLTILSDEEQTNSSPSFSPDGTKIVFHSVRPDESSPVGLFEGICIMNADGSNQVRLSKFGDRDGAPSWSPDGRWIVFNSDRETTPDKPFRQIYVMKADGSGQTRLTDTPGLNHGPAWSR